MGAGRIDLDARRRAARVQALLSEVDGFPEPLRGKATELVRDLLRLYGEALARVTEVAAERDPAMLDLLADDDLVGHLLILHDLHPLDIATRVSRALEEVRPYLRSHGGDVELVGIEEGVARLRLRGSCHGCPSSLMTLKTAIEDAVQRAAPDLEGIEATEASDPGSQVPRHAPALSSGDLPLRVSWITLETAGPPPGSLETVSPDGVSLALVRLGDTFYAYRNACPGCGGAFAGDCLRAAALACPGCGAEYDVRLAGRPLSGSDSCLEPVPLLARDGAIRVALPVDREAAAGADRR
jgi:Fe-S cluster biogenesis protein NfuA/nitrite reductase/ring-hydroxylating ferredoxin subunit